MPSRKSALAAAAAALLTSTACYHAVVETGRPAGSTVVQKPWVNMFLWGLVAAQPIDVSAECPGGLAKVETQLSVPNALATIVTLGLYSPRTATITCASGGGRSGSLNLSREQVVAAAADTPEARAAAVNAAVAEAIRTSKAVYVTF
jgi:hypothetical protein